MPMIDADTHVDESEDTWKKLEATAYAKYIPVTISMPPDEAKRAGYNPTNSRCWVVEGRLQNRAIRDEVAARRIARTPAGLDRHLAPGAAGLTRTS